MDQLTLADRTGSASVSSVDRSKRNGPFTLYMTVGGGNKLPYGNLPRLLLAWVCTEAVRTQRRELVLGRSLSCGPWIFTATAAECIPGSALK